MKSSYSEKVWFSPRFAVQYLWRQGQLHGPIVFGSSNKFKKAREAWVMGVALFGVMKLFGNRWWLQVPPLNQDPPDMKAMAIISDENLRRNEMHEREIEIMYITKYTNASIEEEIYNKLVDSTYIKETALLVYINRPTFIEDMKKLSENLKNKKINVSDIWVIAAESEDAENYVLFSLFPDVQVTRFNLISEMNDLGIGDAIEMKRASGTEMTLERGVPVRDFIPS